MSAWKTYYTIDVRGWWEPMYIMCKSPEERDEKLKELYDMWENDDKWRVCNPSIIVNVHHYSVSGTTGIPWSAIR